jgi:hypothetical protein
MQLIVATKDTAIVTSDGFTDLIGKQALRKRCCSLERKMAEQVEETVGMAAGDGSGHGMASTKDKEETGEDV